MKRLKVSVCVHEIYHTHFSNRNLYSISWKFTTSNSITVVFKKALISFNKV